ncbi:MULTISPECIES: tRNA (adenosine(37)-N6)-threonylcarbamoyltransferase complex dimerization subunit type 1 TsaB [unclassified Massilia]|uniref:tRNA (adenosine(37)-N6)-threonylcarbamoyltransferase complex dimerization subunit type 1 TsaB n=1 Tax=unclassified Massilia TaxID=2609279 RepID=UPI001782C0D7|nr:MULTISPECIES: tRNA (adenosine(37)-N6)-threonylcarbamoyltransferase complex dimerization subunit type 1 TsaB [unclassified Massilia]MBD8531106.1 tRNA (adenosine(37)-N6)-threonylcarbamoyltransferase complex dimerization subunit type 1 TsaB [Massilia sp. CFBP 13647]MBD8674942.1 tRNA (adenosine(37)-N6)-threonylcarbamoyltransferase complex dimerization subunit type 1 TsaB [Massilia sp. CFBP 13721]
MPIILAIETSSELASCALLANDTVIARESGGVRTHSQSVLPMVQELLAEACVKLAEVDAIAFGAGPGSFTGVRTACGVAQGLAFGADLPVLPLNTLEAMAEACRARSGAAEVLAVLDARMNEVYWAQYRFGDGAWHTVIEPALSSPELVAPQPVAGLAACGNGFAVYPDAFAGKDFAADADSGIVPHARDLARIGAAALAAGQGVPAAQAQPLYLRNKVAYTSAERQALNAANAAAKAEGAVEGKRA